MVGREEANHAYSKGLDQRLKEDRISQLPDTLICHILYHLRTKEAVKTSVLSSRWMNLWLWVLSLDLAPCEFPDFNAFLSFSGRFFDSNRVSCIHKVKLTIDENVAGLNDKSYLKLWIDAAVNRKIQHLDVRCPPEFYYEMPLSLYTCETLVSLKLFQVSMVSADFVSLPCLKTMYLEDNWYPNEATCETLVSCCPALEVLKIDVAWNDTKAFRLHSRSLKRLTFVRVSPFKFNSVSGVLIDAPLLCSLSINDHESESFRVDNLSSNAELNISLLFGLRGCEEASFSSRVNSIHNFLVGISRVREMTMCRHTFTLMHRYLELNPLPQFDYMSRLCVSLHAYDLKWLPTFLESCPSLKSLILVMNLLNSSYDSAYLFIAFISSLFLFFPQEWNGKSKKMRSDEINQISFSSVPECLLSSLEFVDIKNSISGHVAEMKLVRYFLECSKSLRKLSLRLNYYAIQGDIFNKLFKIPRRSITCQVVVLGIEKD